MFEETSTIQRNPHDKENPYAQISRALIRDESISPDCRWLIIYLLSMKEGWRINAKQLIKHCKPHMGRDRVYAILNEAIKAGYMKREEISIKGLMKTTYYLSESPTFKKCLRRPGFQDTGNQDTENQDSKEEASFKVEHLKEREEAMPSARSPFLPSKRKKIEEPKHEVTQFVHLTETQRINLFERLGKDPLKERACFDKLSAWKIGKGIVGGNDYQTILNWVIKAVEQDMANPKANGALRAGINEKLAEAIAKTYGNVNDITFGHNYIEFNFGPNNKPYIKFTDNGFEEQVRNCLRKMNLKFPEVKA